MIYGTGIDLIEIDRIKKELEKAKEKFCDMVFTNNEIAYCQRGANLNIQSQCFAGRFVAKEAFFKAIGTGLRDGIRWKDVEVMNNEMGKPELFLQNKALEIIKNENISNIQLSISHSNKVAAAIVILEV